MSCSMPCSRQRERWIDLTSDPARCRWLRRREESALWRFLRRPAQSLQLQRFIWAIRGAASSQVRSIPMAPPARPKCAWVWRSVAIERRACLTCPNHVLDCICADRLPCLPVDHGEISPVVRASRPGITHHLSDRIRPHRSARAAIGTLRTGVHPDC